MALLRFILFFVLFLIIVRLIKLIVRYWSSSRPTIDDLKQENKDPNQKFKDIEEAEFREINFDDKEDIDNQN